MIGLEPLGDRAFLARFTTEREASRWAAAVRSGELEGVTDVVAAYRTAAVFANPDLVDLNGLESRLSELSPALGDVSIGKLMTIPVLYDGPDLDEVASRLGLEVGQVVGLHGQTIYDVFAIGFLPGFPYAGYLPQALSGLARRPDPRLRVAAGSIAIVGTQTGIYPQDSPGGWHILGRTPCRIVDLDAAYFPIRAGDRIQFHSISLEEYEARRDERL